MTEDDTFQILLRSTFDDVAIANKKFQTEFARRRGFIPRELEFFKSHGWTRSEYSHELIRRFNKLYQK